MVATNDPFGNGETNDGGLALTLPMYRIATSGVNTTMACVSNQFGADNKHGSFTYLQFSAPSTRGYAISVAGPAGSDPDFVVYGGAERGRSDGLGTSETATISLTAGDYVLAVNDFENLSSNTCFTVTVN